MLDATDLYRRLRYDLCDMGIAAERAASWAYEALQAVMAGQPLGDWLRHRALFAALTEPLRVSA